MGRTKKVGPAGRFGSRYGRTVKMELTKIEIKQKKTYVCPSCNRKSLRRSTAGIWICRKCKAKIAGGAYSPKTE